MQSYSEQILSGSAVLGVELGSTRIKAVLIGADHAPIAMGSYAWESSLENGVWTYRLEDAWEGVRRAYAELKEDVRTKYGVTLAKLGGMGVSGMMHGYLPFDREGRQLAGFRTWRNTITGEAARKLTELFRFNVPQRWSIAHLYQAMLNGEAHVPQIAHLTTLAGYIHWKLTGRSVMGVGEASGMFPIDSKTGSYDAVMADAFDALAREMGYSFTLRQILPAVLGAGEDAGELTAEGAKLLDPDGDLQPGCPMCPPEGDAGTGMAATNSVAVRTGNVSAGTSVFAMLVMEKQLKKPHEEIDIVATPDGMPVAMVHCNNCTSDINAWAKILHGFAQAAGAPCDMNAVYTALFNEALAGEADCGGFVNVNYFAGETITHTDEGRPLMLRTSDAAPLFANFARSLLFGAVATLKIGMDILTREEKVQIDSLLGHGGFFKTGNAGQKLMAAALNTPVAVMSTAGEGGPWGMALLADYRVRRAPGESLSDYLQNKVFADSESSMMRPEPEDVRGFERYLERFIGSLNAEKAAIAGLK